MHQTLRAAHYFSIRNLRLSKKLPPFVGVWLYAQLRQKPANVDYCARP